MEAKWDPALKIPVFNPMYPLWSSFYYTCPHKATNRILSRWTGASPVSLQHLLHKSSPLLFGTNKATRILGSWRESFFSRSMIDFHSNENRKAIMLHGIVCGIVRNFPNHLHLYLICEIVSLTHTRLLSTSIKLLTPVFIICGTKANPFQKWENLIHCSQLISCPAIMFRLAISNCFSFSLWWRSFYRPFALPSIIANGPGTEAVREVNGKMTWGPARLSMASLTYWPFLTGSLGFFNKP